jgi:phage terminase large subunit-like protein
MEARRAYIKGCTLRQGYIETTLGNVVDYDVLLRRINEDGERFEIRQIAFDRWNATQLCTQLWG